MQIIYVYLFIQFYYVNEYNNTYLTVLSDPIVVHSFFFFFFNAE
jgi:hypothetical protein